DAAVGGLPGGDVWIRILGSRSGGPEPRQPRSDRRLRGVEAELERMVCLHEYLTTSARRRPDHVAVEDPGVGQVTYRELDELSDRLRDRLRRLGVQRGDRVGLALRKSIYSVPAVVGLLKCSGVRVAVYACGALALP